MRKQALLVLRLESSASHRRHEHCDLRASFFASASARRPIIQFPFRIACPSASRASHSRDARSRAHIPPRRLLLAKFRRICTPIPHSPSLADRAATPPSWLHPPARRCGRPRRRVCADGSRERWHHAGPRRPDQAHLFNLVVAFAYRNRGACAILRAISSPPNTCVFCLDTHTHTHTSPTRTGPCTFNAVELLSFSEGFFFRGLPGPFPTSFAFVAKSALPNPTLP